MKNVLELKTKKMSLANIEGKLTPAEMENIMAGSTSVINGIGYGCIAIGIASVVSGFVTFGAGTLFGIYRGGAFCTGAGIGAAAWNYNH